ncbi:AAA family ATPase [Ruegeria arenilitoris]|uniref:AAA family ATPase n=1 Tax=Ruegeria arenilitoris TaxID=1173585 RepID=UPI00147FAD9F|nr:AAA family ATPase [Ruegeria arenilitoris]
MKPNPANDLLAREVDKPKLTLPNPIGSLSFADIPTVQHVFSPFYAEGFVSMTVGPPKLGKSAYAVWESVMAASGYGGKEPVVTYYHNAEDDGFILQGRVAAICRAYGLNDAELTNLRQNLILTGAEHTIDGEQGLILVTGQDAVRNDRAFEYLDAVIDKNGVKLCILEPLQDLTTSPETNEVFRSMGKAIREFVKRKRIALGLYHHTRKLTIGQKVTMDDARGGSAIRGFCRSNRLLVPMTEGEGINAQVKDHRHYFRIGEIEANLAPPSSDVNQWYEKIGVLIENGENVVAVKPWKWPDAFAQITHEMACRVYNLVLDADPPFRYSHQSSEWLGYAIAPLLNIQIPPPSDKQERKQVIGHLRQILATWEHTGVLAKDEVLDAKRMPRPCYVVGQNNPAETEFGDEL